MVSIIRHLPAVFPDKYTLEYIQTLYALGVAVIADQSSNLRLSCVSLCDNTLGRGMDPSLLSLAKYVNRKLKSLLLPQNNPRKKNEFKPAVL